MSQRERLRDLYGALLDAVFKAKPGEPTTPDHSCGDCLKERSAAERRGEHPLPEVREVEVWSGWNGRTYRSGLCFEHACDEWSRAWDKRHAAAKSDAEKQALEDEINMRSKMGRAYVGKRPGMPRPGAHAAACRCDQCRSAAVANAMAGGSR